MREGLIIKKANDKDILTIQTLAHRIWPDAYADILTPDQLAYMLEYIYSPASLEKQMNIQQHQFLLASIEHEPVGFAAYSLIEEPRIYKLHKLYVRTDIQGKGLGKALLETVLHNIQQAGATAFRLNVNRYNKARYFYEKQGFSIIKEEDVDTGNDYFMNDYVMEKTF
jgi:diamine N-acetyltransferase